jgi:hypothetical protein
MTRDEILDLLAEGAIRYVPDIEVVYPVYDLRQQEPGADATSGRR